jgi:cyclopentanol dehydrogenase
VRYAIAHYGKIDGLVNNAGIYPGMFDIISTSNEVWQKVINTNLTSVYYGCKHVIPQLKKNMGGAIVNIASIAGLVGGNGAAYSASKGGLIALSKDLAVTHAVDNIRVNVICPGGVLTPMTEALVVKPEMAIAIKQLSPQGRMADAKEIASGALFLMSNEASFVTGSTLVMDGGAVAR